MDVSDYDEEVNLVGIGITNLKGIEYFTNLGDFDCSGNKLGTLDVSVLPNLFILRCNACDLTSLELGSAPLQMLYCGNNALTTLNVSRQPELERLSFFDNKLTNVDLSNNPRLMHLYCYANQLATLDLSKCLRLARAVNTGA